MGTDEKRNTLMFFGPRAVPRPRLAVPPPPHVRTSSLPDIDAGWDAAAPPHVASVAHVLSSGDLEPDYDDERPSDRKTVPNELAPKLLAKLAHVAHEEISGSHLESDESDRSLATTRPPPSRGPSVQPSLHDLALQLVQTPAPPAVEMAPLEVTPTSLPPISLDVRPMLSSVPAETAKSYPVPPFVSGRTAALFAGSNLAVGVLVLGAVWLSRPEPKPLPRDARIVLDDRQTLGEEVGSATEITPQEGCRVLDLARVIASHVELGPGLDASALESGFGVGLAASANEAVGLRLDAATLRTTESIRVRTPWPFARITVDRGTDEDARMDVHLDAVTAKKGGVFAHDGRVLWTLPGPIPKTNETVRAAAREDGKVIVAVRRPAVFLVGVEGSGLLTAVVRPHMTLGTPALAATYEGGVIAWAERGTSQFTITAATIASDGKRTTVASPVVLAEGISPSIATLPSGELLLAYADGGAGAHRVVVQRLGPDLAPRGDLIVVSPDIANAGQPAVAVDEEGRAIVAFLSFAHGKAEGRATELLCR